MNMIQDKIRQFQEELKDTSCRLIAVSKTKPNEDIMEAYEMGQRDFGENKVQDLVAKYEALPKDIRWHMIGHLQRNKVKYIAPFTHLIHGIDSSRLLAAVEKEGRKIGRRIPILLQIHIAEEETKFGFSLDEVVPLLDSTEFQAMEHIEVQGLMGMATNTTDQSKIESEFLRLKGLNDSLQSRKEHNINIKELSMGMSNDYKLAVKSGSTMIRVGSQIFGARNYA